MALQSARTDTSDVLVVPSASLRARPNPLLSVLRWELRRTHEILMTSALPSRAYIWGRYLAALLVAFGMSCLLLVALLVVGIGLQLHAPDYYPALDLPGTIVIWAVVVLPPTLLFSSLSFAFGLLLPRQSNLVKAGAVFTWFAFSPSCRLSRSLRSATSRDLLRVIRQPGGSSIRPGSRPTPTPGIYS